MKALKKSLALLLAIVMTLALGTTAFAVDVTTKTYTITINDATGTYTAYQIFAGDLATVDNKKILSNVTWGNGVEQFSYNSKTDAAEIAEFLKNADATATDTFAAEAAKHVKANAGTAANATNGSATISNLAAGYYLVVNSNVGDKGSYSKYIVQVVGDVEVASKSDVPTLEKKVKDTNDTTGNTTDWQDSADYDIGDEVPFQLTGTVASNYDDYSTYYFAFHDKEESGLTFNKNSVKVSIDGIEIKSGYTVVTEDLADDCTFHVVFSNLKDITAVKADSEIIVEYTSTLNSDAVLGSNGNVNTAKLQFSNNPNSDQGGESGPTGETPEDSVIVFTYDVVVNKVDQDKKPLPNAGFTLYKEVKQGTEGAVTVEAINDGKYYVAVDTKKLTKNEAGTVFTWEGVDDGNYVIVETTTPNGYNTAEPVKFKVEATHTVTTDVTSSNRTAILIEIKTDNENVTAKNDKSGVTTVIVNKAGSTLPITGGMGTTLFYVIGAILMIGAAVVLVSRKRMASK